jgi:hypothetical protein
MLRTGGWERVAEVAAAGTASAVTVAGSSSIQRFDCARQTAVRAALRYRRVWASFPHAIIAHAASPSAANARAAAVVDGARDGRGAGADRGRRVVAPARRRHRRAGTRPAPALDRADRRSRSWSAGRGRRSRRAARRTARRTSARDRHRGRAGFAHPRRADAAGSPASIATSAGGGFASFRVPGACAGT